MTIQQYIAIFASLILVGIAVFQVALIAGAPLGEYAWGGMHKILPAKLRVSSCISLVIYAVISVYLLVYTRLITIGLSPFWAGSGMWLLVAFFSIGILMNGISRSKKERLVMTPIVIILTVCCSALAFLG